MRKGKHLACDSRDDYLSVVRQVFFSTITPNDQLFTNAAARDAFLEDNPERIDPESPHYHPFCQVGAQFQTYNNGVWVDSSAFIQRAAGQSAYQAWLDQGNTGSAADFLNSLKGQNGGIPEAPLDGNLYARKDMDWEEVPDPGIEEAPNDGNGYIRKDKGWVLSTSGSGGIPEAPSDDKQYARYNGSWAEVARGGQYYTVGQYAWCDMVVPFRGTISVTAIPNIGKDILFCSELTLTVPGGIGLFASSYLISTMANVAVTLSIGAGTAVELNRLSDLRAVVTGGGDLRVKNGAWRCILTSGETSKINISSLYDSELYLDGSSEITVKYGFNSKFYVYGSSSGHLRLKDHKNCEVYDTEFSETRIWCNRAVSSRFYMDYDTSSNDKSLFHCDMSDDRVIFKDCVFSCISRGSHAGQRRALFKLYDASQVEFLNVEFLRNIVVYDQKESGAFSINALFNIELDGSAIPKVKFIIDGNKLAFRDVSYEGDPVSLIYCTSTAEPGVYNPAGTPAIDYLTFRDNVVVHNTPMDHDQVSAIPLVALIAVRSYDINFIQASRNRIYSRTSSNLLIKDVASGSDLLTDSVPDGFLSQSGNYNFSNVPSETMDRLQELWF